MALVQSESLQKIEADVQMFPACGGLEGCPEEWDHSEIRVTFSRVGQLQQSAGEGVITPVSCAK